MRGLIAGTHDKRSTLHSLNHASFKHCALDGVGSRGRLPKSIQTVPHIVLDVLFSPLGTLYFAFRPVMFPFMGNLFCSYTGEIAEGQEVRLGKRVPNVE